MVVGLCRVVLHLPLNRSLKGKRHIIKSIIGRVQGRFNVAIAEVDDNDKWQRAVLGITTVSNDGRVANEVLSHVVNTIEQSHLAEVVDYSIEMF